MKEFNPFYRCDLSPGGIMSQNYQRACWKKREYRKDPHRWDLSPSEPFRNRLRAPFALRRFSKEETDKCPDRALLYRRENMYGPRGECPQVPRCQCLCPTRKRHRYASGLVEQIHRHEPGRLPFCDDETECRLSNRFLCGPWQATGKAF